MSDQTADGAGGDTDDNPYVVGPSPYDEATLRRLYEGEDKTLHEIADELDRSPSTIADWMDDFGIERDGGRPTLRDE